MSAALAAEGWFFTNSPRILPFSAASKALFILLGLMYGLKPVPFKCRFFSQPVKPVPFKLRRVPFN
jgi:hypothetical protein